MVRNSLLLNGNLFCTTFSSLHDLIEVSPEPCKAGILNTIAHRVELEIGKHRRLPGLPKISRPEALQPLLPVSQTPLQRTKAALGSGLHPSQGFQGQSQSAFVLCVDFKIIFMDLFMFSTYHRKFRKFISNKKDGNLSIIPTQGVVTTNMFAQNFLDPIYK